MRRRFVIGIDSFDETQTEQFRDYLADLGAWWHWIGDMWLLTTKNESITVGDIRDKAKSINRNAKVIVLEFPEDIDWATLGAADTRGRNIGDWLKESWAKRD